MKPFATILLSAAFVALSSAEVAVGAGGPQGQQGQNNLHPGQQPNNGLHPGNGGPQQYAAEARHGGVTHDSYGAPAAPVVVDSYNSPPASAWVEQPAGQAYPASSYTFNAPTNGYGNSGLGFSADAEVGFPGQGFLNTALSVVFALVGFSLLISLIAKIVSIKWIANLLGQETEKLSRSLNAETITTYTNLALNGIQKMKDLYEKLE